MHSPLPDRPSPLRPNGNYPAALHVNWKSISVRPWSLMKLRMTINDRFPADTIVALTDELMADYSTPTKRAGQDQPNFNASTRVRVYLWHRETSVVAHPSRDGGKPFSIQHKHLVGPIDGRRKTDRGWGLNQQVKLNADQGVSYTTDKYPLLDPSGVSLSIPNGTVGVVVKCMSGTNRPRTAAQQVSSNRTDWWYVVKVNLQRTQWVWLQCREYVSVLALAPLTAQEEEYTNNLIRSTMGPPQLTVV